MWQDTSRSYSAAYFDGETPRRRAGAVSLSRAGVTFQEAGTAGAEWEAMVWPFEALRVASDEALEEPIRLERRGGRTGEMLAVEEPAFWEDLRLYVPRAGQTRVGMLTPYALVLLLAAGLLGGLVYWSVLPRVGAFAAKRAPLWVEERIGSAAAGIFAPVAERCSDPRAEALLDRVVQRLAAQAPASRYRFRVVYANSPLVNAFAAPAGHVVVFRGLLQQAATAEEFAGVMAHEMQHVFHKHSIQAMARAYSGAMLLRMMAADSSGTSSAFLGAANLADLHYQRQDESEADGDGFALLLKARVDPMGFADFMKRMQADGSGVAGFLSSHPSDEERATKAAAAAREYKGALVPLMTVQEWEWAKQVCEPL
jgi:beta-barrel assembly-enhancing protease